MSTSKNNSKKLITVGVLVIGGLFITAGLYPYIGEYVSSDATIEIDSKEVKAESHAVAATDTTSVSLTETSSNNEQLVVESKNAIESGKQEINETVLPLLHESDTFFLSKINNKTEQSLFVPLDIIRNMVVFVDNFSRGELVANFSPLEKPKGQFTVTEQDGTIIIDTDSYLRYDKYAKAINSLDAERFIEIYSLISPLIDEAYQEIGYPTGSFNHTFDKAINHLLDTPIIYYNLELTSPSVMYQYADENFESLPDTQKLMLRMGPDNLQMVQRKLQEIQNELQRL
ncbi:MAG: DUF3014 domain-containing protein [Psychromonas sp.]|nr:DUF3014 domain-containing protein [Psychromonas sp.]